MIRIFFNWRILKLTNFIFDKAEEAENIEKHKHTLAEIEEQIKQCNEDLKNATDDAEKESLTKQLESYTQMKDNLAEEIDAEVTELGAIK